MRRGNLLRDLRADPGEEHQQTLLAGGETRIERIVSRGHRSPDGFWYDQDEDEWVMLLGGGAGLEIEGEDGILELVPGDWVLLPAHCRHRVARPVEDAGLRRRDQRSSRPRRALKHDRAGTATGAATRR